MPNRQIGLRWLGSLLVWTAALVVLSLVPMCAMPPDELAAPGDMMTLSSPAFADEGLLSASYSCVGSGISPPLTWTGVPPEARSLALVMNRADSSRQGGTVHWIVFNLPPGTTEIPEAYRWREPIEGSVRGVNDFGVIGYDGPCPARGETSRYLFQLFALDAVLDLGTYAAADELFEAAKGHIISEAQMAVYFGYETM